MNEYTANLGPLEDGQSVAILGGGPGGIACALTLQREAKQRGRALNILLLEGKRFGADYNQCAGVLSPPLPAILQDEFDITLPPELCLREIQGYVLHTDKDSLVLNGEEYGGITQAVRRSELDLFLARQAEARGINIIPTRATDLEFRPDGVLVFTWHGTYRVDAIVGAFGLSQTMAASLARQTAYRPPRALETVVTKIHPAGNASKYLPDLLDNYIHTILPPLPRVEFGSLIPKGNHVTVIIAGERLRTDDMDALLALPAVRRLLPGTIEPGNYFKGHFPISLAHGMYGNRYVTVGDAAGLVRPFKGKGINSAVITGGLAARTMMEEGISTEAFKSFAQGCRDITGDMLYGKLIRSLAWISSHHLSMDPVIRLAQRDKTLRELLFDCVSGRESYRRIVLRPGNLRLAARLGWAMLSGR